jgi:hypothetical protein
MNGGELTYYQMPIAKAKIFQADFLATFNSWLRSKMEEAYGVMVVDVKECKPQTRLE